jgi:hypothetical protein
MLFAILTLGFVLGLQYPLPPESTVVVRNDIVYRTVGDQSLHFDLYRPSNHTSGGPLPVVVFMNGIGSPDLRKWDAYTGWGRLVTSIGMAGVTFDTHEGGVTEDAETLLRYLREHSTELHLDTGNVVLWACSSNVSTGLPLAMDSSQTAIKAAVIYYGAAEVKKLRMDVPVLMVRAGLDAPWLNHGIDQFVSTASAGNLPLTFINLPSAHHAFDIFDDNETSRKTIARTLDFMKTNVTASLQREVTNGATEAAAAAAAYRQDWAAAVKSYEGLAASRPRDTEIHRNYANALLSAGEFRRAIAEYERALELGNNNKGLISYSAATASIKLGDTENALKWIETLKDNPPMRRRLGSDPEFAKLRDNARFKAVADIP